MDAAAGPEENASLMWVCSTCVDKVVKTDRSMRDHVKKKRHKMQWERVSETEYTQHMKQYGGRAKDRQPLAVLPQQPQQPQQPHQPPPPPLQQEVAELRSQVATLQAEVEELKARQEGIRVYNLKGGNDLLSQEREQLTEEIRKLKAE
ncbi:uncharacterized protein LOC117648346 [Thrips palmi]|uniref:Uncharacterized protein LOC117648346 n=1 Tax=Thrips palmi TaxID=161013 RepID=A0A6P8Z8R9_THRPL|nr:uncharacterized protein LOC117648346 [Thrips palmi]